MVEDSNSARIRTPRALVLQQPPIALTTADISAEQCNSLEEGAMPPTFYSSEELVCSRHFVWHPQINLCPVTLFFSRRQFPHGSFSEITVAYTVKIQVENICAHSFSGSKQRLTSGLFATV